MSDILKKAAEILVECGYATDMDIWSSDEIGERLVINVISYKYSAYEECNPFYSGSEPNEVYAECLARRQLDAIEDWLQDNNIFILNDWHPQDYIKSHHARRKAQIKWCLEELSK